VNRAWLSVLLMSMYPILVLVGTNIDEIIFLDIILPLVISIVASLALYWLVLRITGKEYVSAVIILVILFFFYYYGHIFYSYFNGIHLGEVTVGRHRFFFPVWVFLFLLSVVFLLRIKSSLKSFSRFLNYLSLVLVVATLMPISIALSSIIIQNNEAEIINESGSKNKESDLTISDMPNIYYIILDGYAASDTFEDLYNYDNSKFYNELEKRGFFVADRSIANHSYTYLSLSSSLNMMYMDWMGSNNENKKKPRDIGGLIDRNKVAKLLKSHGYKYITFDSGYSTSSHSYIADLNVPCAPLSEFDRTLIKTTILDPFFLYGGVRSTILCQFETVGSVAKSGSNFIFSHIIAPHPPFVFDSHGGEVGMNSGLNPWSDKEAYVQQTKFVNVKVIEMIDAIKEQSKVDPIIIIQSDHGPASSGTEEMLNASDVLIKERMRILNAYLVPKKIRENLYKEITPVNTFRLILSKLLKLDLPLLSDRNFFTPIGQDKLVFDDVTGIAKYE
jgi:hypothetical protein